MIGRLSFATTLRIAAVVALLILMPTILLLISRPAAEVQKTATAAQAAPVTRRGVLRTLHFLTITAPFALGITAQVGFIVHQVAFLFPALGREGVSLAVALTMAMAVIGRIGLGLFIDGLDQRLVAAVLLALQATALLVMLQASTPAVLYIAWALFGLAVGNVITLPALIIQREYPPGAFGMLSALAVAITQLTYAFGPGLLGWLRDATGGYSVPLAVCMTLELAAAALVLLRIGPARIAAERQRSRSAPD